MQRVHTSQPVHPSIACRESKALLSGSCPCPYAIFSVLGRVPQPVLDRPVRDLRVRPEEIAYGHGHAYDPDPESSGLSRSSDMPAWGARRVARRRRFRAPRGAPGRERVRAGARARVRPRPRKQWAQQVVRHARMGREARCEAPPVPAPRGAPGRERVRAGARARVRPRPRKRWAQQVVNSDGWSARRVARRRRFRAPRGAYFL